MCEAPKSRHPEYKSTLYDYENILKICQSGQPIPQISLAESADILQSVRADVNDFFSITANHFLHAGHEGLQLFHFLLSAVLNNVHLACIDELNTAWACILYKGHKKDRESDRSYRNISTCPFLAKCADTYVGRLNGPGWAEVQAPTQFQGEGSSHELAALLLSETIQYSLYYNNKTVYILLLDAQSAFDKIIRQCAIRSAFLAGTCDQGLLYLDHRLASRRTFPEWGKVLMGPIDDSLGLEQGGVNSDKLYKLCNNNQLSTAQLSGLGVDCGAATVSSIGQADDTVLVSDCIYRLAGLVYLAEQYCRAFHVTLVPKKTKLLAFSPAGQQAAANMAKIVNPISIAGNRIEFCNSAEHVGIVRSTEGGNMPHILDRIAAHRRAIAGVLHCGLARGHRGNPVAGLRLEKLYGAPRLLSGVAALVLSTPELSALSSHYRTSIRRLLRLPANTPEPFVMMMAGSLPLSALLHLRMLGLLGMVARLGSDGILNRIGRHALLTPVPRSWFVRVRHITAQYGLPDPLLVLQQPPPKGRWKSICRSRVTDYWEQQLRGAAVHLDSLANFKSNFFSLSRPHRTFTTAGSPYEVAKASVVCLMLSGRYQTDHRRRHWDPANPTGACRLCPEAEAPGGPPAPAGDLQHQLLVCPALGQARARAERCWAARLASRPHLHPVLTRYSLGPPEDLLGFLLDPSSCPPVILLAREHGESVYQDCHYLSRVWCFGNHRARLKLLKLFAYM
jgi:hypothetical protein